MTIPDRPEDRAALREGRSDPDSPTGRIEPHPDPVGSIDLPDRDPERLQALAALLGRELPMAAHMGVRLLRWDETGLEVWAPAAPNMNVHGTLFGGSLAAVALLAGWGWIRLELEARGVPVDVVVQDSRIRYDRPVRRDVRARVHPPSRRDWQRFVAMLARRGRGRLSLEVELGPEPGSPEGREPGSGSKSPDPSRSPAGVDGGGGAGTDPEAPAARDSLDRDAVVMQARYVAIRLPG